MGNTSTMTAFSETAVPPQLSHIENKVLSETEQIWHINIVKIISYWRHFEGELGLHSYSWALCLVQIRQTALSLPIKFRSPCYSQTCSSELLRMLTKYILRTLHPHVAATVF